MRMPVEYLNSMTTKEVYVSNSLSLSVLNAYGVSIIKGALSDGIVSKYIDEYYSYKTSKFFDRNVNHLTEVRISSDNPLINIIHEEQFKSVASQLFGGGVGIYNIRIIKKDVDDRNPVFLHQDVGYQYGAFNRFSFFIPLSNCNKDNGGLTFVPGSHKFGYLGDAGAIREAILPEDLLLITPDASPGDIIIMNSYLWHKSGNNMNGLDRVYYDIHVNSSDDPASKFILDDSQEREYHIDYALDRIFDNSRLQRLERYAKKFGKI
jgi:hypothetical protein